MFTHLPKKSTLLIASSLVFSLAGGLERESRVSSYTAPAPSASSAAATPASTSSAAATETLVTAPFNSTRSVWISRSLYRPAN